MATKQTVESVILIGLLCGCATPIVPPAPQPFTAEAGAERFDARSLHDLALHDFLVRNLGHSIESFDFEALCWVAFYYHPLMAVARAQWDSARGAETAATARANPTLSLVPGYNSTRETGVSPWFPGINADFLFRDRQKIRLRGDVAKADSDSQRLRVISAAWKLRGELRRSLIEAGNAASLEKLWARQLQIQKALLHGAEQQLDEGAISVADVSALRVAHLRAEAQYADVGRQVQIARARVATSLGLATSALVEVALPVPEIGLVLSAEKLRVARKESLRRRADILVALAHYRSTQAALELELAKQRPDLHLGPGYQWDQGANKWSLSLSFEIRLFHRNEGPISEAVARRAEAAAEVVGVQAAAIANVDTAFTTAMATRERLSRTARIREEGHRRSSAAEQQFTLGALSQSEYQTILLEEVSVELAGQEAQFANAVAEGELEDALQTPFGGSETLASTSP